MSETIHGKPTKNHTFELTPTPDMESKVKMIVFYVTDYGEIVFDSLDLEFVELKNFVSALQLQNQCVFDEDGNHF